MICLNWNVEWAVGDSPEGEIIRSIVNRVNPDVMCLTETTLGMVPASGHFIASDPEYGYPNNGTRRKVVLWSREPWSEIDTVGAPSMPSGRFVSGITQGIRFAGVCIPWKDAHVRSGRRDRALWEDHLAYLSGFASVLAAYRNSMPLCVLGDYNQNIPRKHQPSHVAQALTEAFGDDLLIATTGKLDNKGERLVDHYAHTNHLTVEVLEIIPKRTEDETKLSDHVGVVASISFSG